MSRSNPFQLGLMARFWRFYHGNMNFWNLECGISSFKKPAILAKNGVTYLDSTVICFFDSLKPLVARKPFWFSCKLALIGIPV